MKIGFLNLLTLLFIGLKLTNNITWSWWFILAPSYVPAAFTLFALLLHVYYMRTDPFYRLDHQKNVIRDLYNKTGKVPW